MLERAVRRIERHLDRRGLLGTRENDLDLSGEGDPSATSPPPRSQASPRPPARDPPRGGFALVGWTSAPQAPGARLRQAAVRITRWLHAARSDPRRRARRRGSRGPASICLAPSDLARASGATPRPPHSHHPPEGASSRILCSKLMVASKLTTDDARAHRQDAPQFVSLSQVASTSRASPRSSAGVLRRSSPIQAQRRAAPTRTAR